MDETDLLDKHWLNVSRKKIPLWIKEYSTGILRSDTFGISRDDSR